MSQINAPWILRSLLLALSLTVAGPALAGPGHAHAPLTAVDLLGAIDVGLTDTLMRQYGLDEAAATRFLDDTKQRRYVRQRALSALTILRTDSARQRIERAALSDHDQTVRAEAIVVLARGFAQLGDAAAERFLRHTATAQLKGHPAEVLRHELARLTRLAQP
jgi:hypothetical protein